MIDYIVQPQRTPLTGTAFLPSDKSLAHRAVILAALARGVSHVDGRGFGDDVLSTVSVLRALGVPIQTTHDSIIVHGRGLHGFEAPRVDLDCGNSGTTMRLMAGVLVAQHFPFRLVGDASLSRRPMGRIATPLVQRGALLEGTPGARGELFAPLFSEGRAESLGPLQGLTFDAPVASAQVKSALLLSGLYARGATVLTEPSLSRDHTERMLRALGVPVRSEVDAGRARVTLDAVRWEGTLPSFDVRLAGDFSAAAFLVATALVVPKSAVVLEGVGTNPTRTGMLDWLSDARIEVESFDAAEGGLAGAEPVATLSVGERAASRGQGAPLSGGLLVRGIDEVPAMAAVAATLPGVTTVRDAKELRYKESDRLRACAKTLRAFGVRVREYDDGLEIEGTTERLLSAADIDSEGDHRIAMMATVLSLRADGPCRVRGVECIATSFPSFAETLRSLGASVQEVPSGN